MTASDPLPKRYPPQLPVRRWLRNAAIGAACLGPACGVVVWMTAPPGEIWVRTLRDDLGTSYAVRLSQDGEDIDEYDCDWSVFRTPEGGVHLHWVFRRIPRTTRERVLEHLRRWLSRPHCLHYAPAEGETSPPGEALSRFVRSDAAGE